MQMTRHEAVRIFGSQSKLAKAMGISRQAVCQWPHTLPQRLSDEVIGCAVRCGLWTIDEGKIEPVEVRLKYVTRPVMPKPRAAAKRREVR